MGKSTISMAIFYVANCKRLPVAGVVGILRTYWLMGRLNRGIYQLFYLRSLGFKILEEINITNYWDTWQIIVFFLGTLEHHWNMEEDLSTARFTWNM